MKAPQKALPQQRLVWLSVDFDFFVREEPIWDFGHAEAPIYRDVLWAGRHAGFLSQGVDLVTEMDPAKHSKPAPADFVPWLRTHGYTFKPKAPVFVADSHAFGAPVFRDGMPLDADVLVNFDAHHDLGYSAGGVRQHVRRSVNDCADWVPFVLSKHRRLQYRQTYPVWRGLDEWDSLEPLRASDSTYPFKRQLQRAWCGLASDADFVRGGAGHVVGVFVCRSGSWVPPWLDSTFISVVDALADACGGRPLAHFQEDENCNPLVPRPYNLAAVQGEAADRKSFFDRLEAVHKQMKGD